MDAVNRLLQFVDEFVQTLRAVLDHRQFGPIEQTVDVLKTQFGLRVVRPAAFHQEQIELEPAVLPPAAESALRRSRLWFTEIDFSLVDDK